MLPKFLYESSPYFCLTVGSISIAFPTDALQAISGAILYCTGTSIWIMRSRRRRKDSSTNNILQGRQRYIPWQRGSLLPESLYESLPFVYILIGIILQRHTQSAVLISVGFIVFGLGIIVLGLRHRYRTNSCHENTEHINM